MGDCPPSYPAYCYHNPYPKSLKHYEPPPHCFSHNNQMEDEYGKATKIRKPMKKMKPDTSDEDEEERDNNPYHTEQKKEISKKKYVKPTKHKTVKRNIESFDPPDYEMHRFGNNDECDDMTIESQECDSIPFPVFCQPDMNNDDDDMTIESRACDSIPFPLRKYKKTKTKCLPASEEECDDDVSTSTDVSTDMSTDASAESSVCKRGMDRFIIRIPKNKKVLPFVPPPPTDGTQTRTTIIKIHRDNICRPK